MATLWRQHLAWLNKREKKTQPIRSKFNFLSYIIQYQVNKTIYIYIIYIYYVIYIIYIYYVIYIIYIYYVIYIIYTYIMLYIYNIHILCYIYNIHIYIYYYYDISMCGFVGVAFLLLFSCIYF